MNYEKTIKKPSSCDKLKALKLQQGQLWDDHYWRTREVIRDAASKSPCFEVDSEALYNNQDRLGENFSRLTGNEKAGIKLAKELRIHIDIAIGIVESALLGKDITNLYKVWQENATLIAKIYHKYHCPIKFKKMNEMMQEHLATTLAEAVAIISGTCKESQEAGDIALVHIRMMSAYLNSTFECEHHR
jgi:hypothetical protein